jgi:hypothetical protein
MAFSSVKTPSGVGQSASSTTVMLAVGVLLRRVLARNGSASMPSAQIAGASIKNPPKTSAKRKAITPNFILYPVVNIARAACTPQPTNQNSVSKNGIFLGKALAHQGALSYIPPPNLSVAFNAVFHEGENHE